MAKNKANRWLLTANLLLTISFSNYALADSSLASATPTPAPIQPLAQPTPPPSNSSLSNNQLTDGWHFVIAPYAWASAIDGTVSVQGHSANMHYTFGDILSHLNFAAQGHIEGGYGPWSLMVDPTYLKLTISHQGIINPTIVSKTTLIDSGVFYRAYATPLSGGRFFTFDLLGGVRYLNINNQLGFPNGLSFGNDIGAAAPIVGGRIKVGMSPKTYFWLRGDVGGFHVDTMNNTWSSTAGVAYAPTSHFELGLAYRVLKIDISKTNTSMNTYYYGPMIGFALYA